MSQDDVTTEEVVEQTNSSEETQNTGEEDNSLSESKKNQSNFKKLAKRLKEERKERERLEAELKKFKSGTEDEDEDFGLEEDMEDSTDEAFSDVKSELWFLKNKEAEQYREKMAEMVEDNALYSKLPLKDLYELAQARYKKSVTKTNFDVSSGKSGSKTGSIDFSQMSEEQIEKLNPAQSKLFLEWMKKQK